METKNNCDFSGYATRNDLECGDGRVIRRDAFKHNSGVTVPLVWNHEHTQDAILGHALLENRDDGVYAYGFFNDTEQGQHAKKLVQNGDISSLSIWATRLIQMGKDVIHGDIKELIKTATLICNTFYQDLCRTAHMCQTSNWNDINNVFEMIKEYKEMKHREFEIQIEELKEREHK